MSGHDRPQAIARLARALEEYEIAGVETTLPLFRALAADPDFRSGRFHTQWLDGWLASHEFRERDATDDEVAFAAVSGAVDGSSLSSAPGSGDRLSRWRVAARREALRSAAPPAGHPGFRR